MPQEVSKITDPDATASATAEAVTESSKQASAQDATESGEESGEEAEETVEGAEGAKEKKKRSRKKKIKNALTGKGKEPATAAEAVSAPGAGKHLSKDQINQLLAANPALANELKASGQGPADLEKMIRNLNVNELLTGMTTTGRNQKDMASHAFWKTQPVLRFDELAAGKDKIVDGPIKEIDIDRVPKEPSEMHAGFEWVTMDLDDENQLKEVYDLLDNHYVEDLESMFRFKYSSSFLNWALKAPGWKKDWHVGVRAKESKRLVAFISGIPVELRVRENVLHCSEINFLCVHKKLRSKRLAPVLIKEITRRCYLHGVFQAIYTVGTLLPTPVSTCRYFHRALDWEKLYDVGFSPLPAKSTKLRQITRYKLPDTTFTPGLRPIESKDVDAVLDLLKRYLSRIDMAQVFSKEDFVHWMSPETKPKDQVVWGYVVEDPSSKKITDYVSFYSLSSTVIGNKKHSVVNAAYLFYYATEAAFDKDPKALKVRLNALIKDALILAKNAKFDVFNALTLLDNPLFLDEQRFGAGDGQLHYYLYNYRAQPLAGGIDQKNSSSDKHMGGVGLVML